MRILHATVVEKDGKRTLKMKSANLIRHYLGKMMLGQVVQVEIHEIKPTRSMSQNNYYWGVYLPLIADETGDDVESLHELFKKTFLIERIGRARNSPVPIYKSTSQLSRGEFGEYIMKIEELTGIQAPPTDVYFYGEVTTDKSEKQSVG